jgi:hypothetical protein
VPISACHPRVARQPLKGSSKLPASRGRFSARLASSSQSSAIRSILRFESASVSSSATMRASSARSRQCLGSLIGILATVARHRFHSTLDTCSLASMNGASSSALLMVSTSSLARISLASRCQSDRCSRFPPTLVIYLIAWPMVRIVPPSLVSRGGLGFGKGTQDATTCRLNAAPRLWSRVRFGHLRGQSPATPSARLG